MTILLADQRIANIPVIESHEPLVDLYRFGVWYRQAETAPSIVRAYAPQPGRLVRRGLAERLAAADAALPRGLRLQVVEGFRDPRSQQRIIAAYSAELAAAHPGIDAVELRRLSSRFVAPIEVAPHIAGAAVDLTFVDRDGLAQDMGTAIDATPEQSRGACFFDAKNISRRARRNRQVMAAALGGAGLVNYPTEWWHWSFGDRYWAYTTGAGHAAYGPATTSLDLAA